MTAIYFDSRKPVLQSPPLSIFGRRLANVFFVRYPDYDISYHDVTFIVVTHYQKNANIFSTSGFLIIKLEPFIYPLGDSML